MIYVANHCTDDGDIPLGYYTTAAAACRRVEEWEGLNNTGESFCVNAYEVDAVAPSDTGSGLREMLIYDYATGPLSWREVDVTEWAAHG